MKKYPIVLSKLPGQGTTFNVLSSLIGAGLTVTLSYTLITLSPHIVNKPDNHNRTQSMLMMLFTAIAQMGIGIVHNLYQQQADNATLRVKPLILASFFCYGVFPFTFTLYSVAPEQPYEPLKPILMNLSYLCTSLLLNLLSYGVTTFSQKKGVPLLNHNFAPENPEEEEVKLDVEAECNTCCF